MKRRRLAWLGVAVSALLTGCAKHEPAEPPANDVPRAQAARATPPAGWSTFELRGIQFFGPPDLVDQHANGEDSLVGLFVSPSMQVDFDFGWYSDDSFIGHFDGKRMRDGTLEQVVIDGHPARLGTWSDNRYPPALPNTCAIYVPDIARTGEAVGETKLDFRVSYRDARDAETARNIVLSVRIAPGRR
jgi:hypothetical protein